MFKRSKTRGTYQYSTKETSFTSKVCRIVSNFKRNALEFGEIGSMID